MKSVVMTNHWTRRPIRGMRGFTLVELMIALVLGLVIIGGVISVFLANKQSYRSNEALGQVQDTSRVSFELLSRDIRSAGGTPCGNPPDRIANVINDSDGSTYDWTRAIWGYDEATNDPVLDDLPADSPEPVEGTSSIHVMGAALSSGISVMDQKQNAANFKISESTEDFKGGDIIMVCDPDHATLLQISNYNDSNVTVEYNTGKGTPGNCSKGLGIPTECTTNGNPYEFGVNSQLAKLEFYVWYVGVNEEGGRSLYRAPMVTDAAIGDAVEMVRGVTGLTATYHRDGENGFETATDLGTDEDAWEMVNSVRIQLTAQSREQRVTTDADSQPLERSLASTVTLRNRVN